jgi:hypothetical protein
MRKVTVTLIIVVSPSDDLDSFFLAIDSTTTLQTRRPDATIVVLNGIKKSAANYIRSRLKEIEPTYIVFERMNIFSVGLNAAIQAANTDYIARIDPDDISLPARLELQMAFLEKHSEYDVLGAGVKFGGKHVRSYPAMAFRKKMFLRNIIAHPTVIFKKEAVLKVGGYPLVRNSQDYLLWLRILKSGGSITNLDVVGVDVSRKNIAARRGVQYFKGEVQVLCAAVQEGLIPINYVLLQLCARAAIRLLPLRVRGRLYE